MGRYLSDNAPDDLRVAAQDVRSDVFSYLENVGGWKQPTIRPDFVFRQRRRVVAVADAKVDRPTTLLFAPSAVTQHVRIRLVGVPVDRMLEDTFFRWWPLDQRRTATVPVSVPTSFFALGSQKLG